MSYWLMDFMPVYQLNWFAGCYPWSLQGDRLRAVSLLLESPRGKTSTIFREARVACASGEAARRARVPAPALLAALPLLRVTRASNFVFPQLFAFFPRIFEQKRYCSQSTKEAMCSSWPIDIDLFCFSLLMVKQCGQNRLNAERESANIEYQVTSSSL